MVYDWFSKIGGSIWTGRGELWLDPEGNSSECYECTLKIQRDSLYYTWLYENKTQTGIIAFNKHQTTWIDSWHQPELTQCENIPNTWSIFTIKYTYKVPSNPDWGWQIKLSERPDGTLVLQMSNIAPWGEDGRAVRMIFTREKAHTTEKSTLSL